MNHYEEELQKNIEAGKEPNANSMDAKAYQQVFQSLKREPEFSLPADFADRVVAKAIQLNTKTSFFGDYFWLGVGIFFMVIAFIVAIAFTGYKLDFGFLNSMSGYKGL